MARNIIPYITASQVIGGSKCMVTTPVSIRRDQNGVLAFIPRLLRKIISPVACTYVSSTMGSNTSAPIEITAV